MSANEIAARLAEVEAAIAQAAAKSRRNANEIELVAVFKAHEAEKIRVAIEAGHQLFGESKVQEARAKIPLLPSSLRWHFIGHLQKNKIRHALPLFDLIHSIDSLDLAQQIDRIATEEGSFPRVLLQVNVAREASKFGFKPELLIDSMEALLSLSRLTVEGLMCIPPLSAEPENSRRYFVQLRELRDHIETQCHCKLPQLSMGMTTDYAVAVEEGATLVRVGTAIFGERKRAKGGAL